MHHTRAILAIGTALGSSLICFSAAQAQSAAPAAQSTTAEGELAEIVVIARGRAESLQTVPIAVSSFDAKTIEDAGIERPADFISFTPNVSVAETQQPGTAFITIRGISQVRNGESPVAVVVDGVLQTVSNQFNTELFDLQQIEVLKGPQGALYGRNSIGGAIVVTTRAPSDEFFGRVTVGAGNGDQHKAQIGVSGPIIEGRLFGSIAGSFRSREGFLENVYLNKKVDFLRDTAVRGRLIFDATDALKIDYRASYNRTHSGALYFKRNNVLASGFYQFYPTVRSTASNPGSPDDYGPPLNSNIDGDALRKIYSTSLKVDLETSLGTLTSTSSYDEVSELTLADASPYTSAAAGTQTSNFMWFARSTELRLTSPSDQRLRYIVGGYYLDLARKSRRANGVDTGPGIVLPGYNPANSVNPSTNNTADNNDQTSYALFGQLNFDITEQLELAGAIRYDHDKRDTLNVSHPKDAGSLPTYTPVGTPGAYREASFDAWQPKVTLRYKIDSGTSVYASYSKGFRSGGFNQDGVRAIALRLNPNSAVTDDYKKEISTSWEAGFKARFLDRRLTLNGAVFHTRFNNAQYFVFIPEASAQIITNIDKATMKGAELDVSFRPMTGWEIYGNVGYTDAEIDKYVQLPASEGKTMPYVPKLGYSLGTQYTYALTGDLDLIGRVDLHHKGRQYWETLNTAGARSAFNLVDARVSIADADRRWKLSAWTKNAFDKKYLSEFVGGGFAYPGEPRSYGIELDYEF
ncbi:TonB-dependent receptor [Phenylobacterium zucineum HLK1]|uniref:TonB-dependent receptor n=1 Tax=Phenylobacterium zucineum (strain HLK1) TaxID=450851 RepID=B4RGE1_PHEZH|nr:TonB-dependent receptor [Phenylobacterium zucineum]ACG78847.1 TonB-dependent receptor [Phenylobacterium zucineum HLK1]